MIPEVSSFCRYCGAAQHGEEASAYRAEAPVVRQATLPAPQVERVAHTRQVILKQHEVVGRRHLAPRTVWLFFINYNLRMGIVLPGFLLAIYFEPLAVGLLLAYLLVIYLIAQLVYNYFYFTIDNNNFTAEYGIIHKKHVSIPFQQIQNVNIKRTFIDRLLGLSKLEVESAGTASLKMRDIVGGTRSRSEGFLPGLSMEDAMHIHDVLLVKKEYSHKNGN